MDCIDVAETEISKYVVCKPNFSLDLCLGLRWALLLQINVLK